ncbi:MAG: DNA polymerase III subunit gamma/tau [Deltaproteobacteria bacterium]|nr:DNA polymerase III subunit gamma/tau [Deltaproteobacteria bacterium]
MSYQVLARKYRPQRFEEVVGQRHVTQTLQNALEQKRLHHAYLFCGARGIGKTTVARILAKALNCEKGVVREPCDQCGPCREILEGKSLDVQEIDGASNTGVDDVRQIREQTKYMPASGRYKIYIIDEVHMLSTAAFNALLKTLEEPPPHVIFIFATTEAGKIPVTILSRCQRYDFRRIPVAELTASLEEVAKSEQIDCASDVLHLIAHEAQGSLRDAQSLFDQAIAFAGKKIRYENLKEMLGFLDKTQLFTLIGAILKKDRQAALEQLNLFYQAGSDLNRLAQELLLSFRHLFLAKSLGRVPDWLDLPKEEAGKWEALSGEAGLETFDQLYNIAYRGAEETARASYPKMVLEVLIVRMTLVSEVVPINQILEKLEGLPAAAPSPAASVPGKPERQAASTSPLEKTWDQFVEWLLKEKPQMASIVQNGRLSAFKGNQIALAFDKDSIYGDMLKEEDRKKIFSELLKKFFGREMTLELSSPEAGTDQTKAAKQEKEKASRHAALTHESVKEAANILGAVVEEVRTKQ